MGKCPAAIDGRVCAASQTQPQLAVAHHLPNGRTPCLGCCTVYDEAVAPGCAEVGNRPGSARGNDGESRGHCLNERQTENVVLRGEEKHVRALELRRTASGRRAPRNRTFCRPAARILRAGSSGPSPTILRRHGRSLSSRAASINRSSAFPRSARATVITSTCLLSCGLPADCLSAGTVVFLAITTGRSWSSPLR